MVLDTLQKIFSIIGSLSLGLALATYFYKKRQDETLAAIDQIAFFREKIIPEWIELSRLIKIKNPKYWFSHIKLRLNKYSIENIKEEFSYNFNDQLSLFFDININDSGIPILDPILNKQVTLLNLLEEFSLKVNHFKTQQHSALDSVKNVFVDLVEQNAVAIVFMRDILRNSPIYSATLSLYNSWESNFQKPNYINNLEKHGFITKEKKKEILKIQRENVTKNNKRL